MRIGNISGNTSFGRIYQVIGQRKDMQQLRLLVAEEKRESNNPAMIYNLTNHNTIPKSISEKLDGRQLCVVVTGDKTLKQTNRLTGKDLSEYLMTSCGKFIKISNNVKKDASDILQSIKDNK